jgi:hypothetical protein
VPLRLRWLLKNIKIHTSPGTDQIPAELIKYGFGTICYEIHQLTYSVWNEEGLHEEWKESTMLRICKKGDKTDRSNYRSISLCQLRTKFYPTSCCQVSLHMQRKLVWIISVDFDATVNLRL